MKCDKHVGFDLHQATTVVAGARRRRRSWTRKAKSSYCFDARETDEANTRDFEHTNCLVAWTMNVLSLFSES
jgi:hypothetical protein